MGRFMFFPLAVLLSIGFSSAFVRPGPFRTVSPRRETKLVLADSTEQDVTKGTRPSGFANMALRSTAAFVLSPAIAGKAFGTFEAGVGLGALFNPEKTIEVMGLQPAPSLNLFMRYKGALSLGAAVITLGTVVKGLEASKSFGYGLVPLLFCLFTSIARGDVQEEWGLPSGLVALAAAFVGGGIYGCLSGATWARLATKIFSAAFALEGLALIFMPKVYFGLFGLSKHKLEEKENMFGCKVVGVTEAHFGGLAAALVKGIPPLKSLGYSIIPYVMFAWWNLFGGNAEDVGLNKSLVGTVSVAGAVAAAALVM